MARVLSDRYGALAKLDDCGVHGPVSGAELFLVEGDSAAAAVAGVRDPATQAVLPMQGKPLNATRASRSKVLAHPFFAPLVAALDVGIEADCDPRRLRYERVLVLTDPDADGIHCGFLVLLFFHRWLRPLLDAGRVEIVRPPWGEVVVAGRPTLAFSEPELACWRIAPAHAAVGPYVVFGASPPSSRPCCATRASPPARGARARYRRSTWRR